MLVTATKKLFWFDELFTYHIAQLPNATKIINVMATTGGDTQPPLLHLISHGLLYLPLQPEIAMRLPSLLGFCVMIASVYIFTRRHASILSSYIAVLILIPMFVYAIEARPYGLWLGCGSLAMLMWRKSAEEKITHYYAVALCICLTLCVNLHFYGIVTIGPFLCAELERYRRERKIRTSMWLALLVPLLSMVALYPFAVYAHKFSSIFWAIPNLWSSYYAYDFIIGKHMLIMLGLLVIAVYECRKIKCPSHEMVFLISSFSLPLAIHVISLVTNAYTPRYALMCLPGTAILIACLLQSTSQKKFLYGSMVVSIVLLAVQKTENMVSFLVNNNPASKIAMFKSQLAEYPNAQFATVNGHVYLQFLHYANPDPGRFFYIETKEESSVLIALNDMAAYYPVEVAPKSLLDTTFKDTDALIPSLRVYEPDEIIN